MTTRARLATVEDKTYPKAILMMVAGFSIVPVMDAIAKYLSTDYPVAQIAWARFVFHLSIILPVILWRHGTGLWPRRPVLQLARGAFQMGATLLFFSAIARMPIADALALLFSYPLIVTALSPLLLRERVSTKQWIAVVAGLAGVLFILRPGLGGFRWAGALALAAGASFALYMITTRKVSGSAPPLVTLAYSAIAGTVMLSAAAPSFWVAPTPRAWAWMILIGVLAATGHFLIVKAFELASAPRLAPLGYVEIVVATILGYAVFDDFPDVWTFLGIAIIIASGVLVSTEREAIQP